MADVVPSIGQTIMPNLKFALRTLFKTPFVTLVAIVSLALGIGANAAIFSLFNHMLLQPLPVEAPDQLVNLSAPGPEAGFDVLQHRRRLRAVFSYPMFRDLEKVQTVFTGIAAHRIFGANLSYAKQTINAEGMLVSGCYFPVLGMRPALGRLLGPGDDPAPGESRVVVLSYTYWQRHFGADPGVLNQSMIVNGQTMTIVGVAPRGFEGTTLGVKPNVFVPITMREIMTPGWKGLDNRRSYWAYLFARLKPGVTMEQATRRAEHAVPRHHQRRRGAAAERHERADARAIPRESRRRCRPAERGQSSVRREARAPLNLLLGVTGFVLLIACANIANLLLARSAARAAEMAVRLSIGASRRQLVGQLLTESCLLAVFGGVAGLLVARWTLDLILSLMPQQAARHAADVARTVDARVRRGAHARHRAALRAVPRAPQHAAGSRRVAQGSGRPAVGREVGRAVPHVAGHGADRAVDGAARRRRALHQEPVQRHAASTSA